MAVKYRELVIAPVPRTNGSRHTAVIVNNSSPCRFWVLITDPEVESTEIKLYRELDKVYLPILKNRCTNEEIVAFREALLEDLEDDTLDIDIMVEELERCLGSYCVVFYGEENIFLRGIIYKWMRPTRHLKVFSIDRAHMLSVPFKNVYPMVSSITKFPHLAIPCYLDGVYPPGSAAGMPIPDWTDDGLKGFRNLLETSDKFDLEIKIHDGAHLPTAYPVKLCDLSKELDINLTMIRNGYGITLDSPPTLNQKLKHFLDEKRVRNSIEMEKAFENYNPMADEFKSMKNHIDVNYDDPVYAVHGCSATDEKNICPIYARTGYCYKEDSCRKKHERFLPSGYSSDVMPIYSDAFLQLDDLNEDKSYTVSSTEIMNIQQFYVVTENDMKKHMKDLSQLETDEKSRRLLKPLLCCPSELELVLVQFEDHWVRGRCIVPDVFGGRPKILLVDMGMTEAFNESDLRQISADWLHVPLLARKCALANVEVAPDVSLVDVKQCIDDWVKSATNLQMKVIEHCRVNFTYYVDFEACDIGCLSEYLVKRGFARHDERDVFIIDGIRTLFA